MNVCNIFIASNITKNSVPSLYLFVAKIISSLFLFYDNSKKFHSYGVTKQIFFTRILIIISFGCPYYETCPYNINDMNH